MTGDKVSDALRNWRERLASLPPDQRAAATAVLLALMRARAAAMPEPARCVAPWP